MEITDKHIEQFLAAAHQTGERRVTRGAVVIYPGVSANSP